MRRWTLGVVGVGLVLLAAAALVATLRAGGEPPPASGAAAVVPANALLYVHLSTDPSRPAVKRGQALLARLPDHGAALAGLLQRLIDAVGGSPATQYRRDIRPWLGKEAAFAVADTSTSSAGTLIVLDVRKPRRALGFITGAGAQPVGGDGATAIYRYATGIELAFVSHYLVAGQDASVRAAIAAGTHRGAALQSDAAYRAAASGEPAGRVLDLYLPAAGVTRILSARQGALGALGVLLWQPALRGAALSVSATAPGATVAVRSALDPAIVASQPAPEPFAPELAGVLPAGSALMIDGHGLSGLGATVMRASGQIGVLAGLPTLLARLGAALSARGTSAAGVMDVFAGETAIALVPGSANPTLVIVTRPADADAARATLAGLQAPLAALFPPPANGPGLAPEWTDVQVGAVTAHQLVLTPSLQLDYAVFDGLVVVSSSLRGIADVAGRVQTLRAQGSYRRVLGESPDRVSSLLFADFSQLLNLDGQTTLPRSAEYRALRPDLAAIRAMGVYFKREESDTTAELFLQIP